MTAHLTIKDHIRESHQFNARAVLALVIMALLTLGLMGRLVYLQVMSHEHFTTLSDENRVNLTPAPPTRGLIFDRDGELLAQNSPAFSLEVVPEQVDNLEATLERLQELLPIDDDDISRFRQHLARKHPFESLPLKLHLSEKQVAKFAVNRHRFPGVDIQARLTRDYPRGKLAAHAIGYMGRINEQELKRLDSSNYRGTTHVGKTGIEKTYEDLLHGKVGYQQVETNALGRVLRVLERTPPVPGQDLYLTLDADLQQVAEEALADRRGAVVALDPNTGAILALASMPQFNPNTFVDGLQPAEYKRLRTSPDQPLFNRALRGQYPPGSTIKPLVGLAGLETNQITADSSTFCRGWYSLEGDDRRYRDWKRTGHGHMNLSAAIMRSCDVYFYDLARTLGIDTLHNYLVQFGLGQATGVDLPGEQAGLVPSREWKRRAKGEPWYTGETLITGIGQGFTLATPLQLTVATATLANRGARIQPYMLHAVQDPATNDMNVREPPAASPVAIDNSDHWDQVISAMGKVTGSPGGTAHAVGRNADYTIAGKTGTSQVFELPHGDAYDELDQDEIAERLRDHALFVAFAPIDDPQIAVSVIIENGGSGGSVAGPVARRVMDHYLLQEGS